MKQRLFRLRQCTAVLCSNASSNECQGDDGMTTAEYAVGTLAACGFAAVLLRVVTSTAVRDLLDGLIQQALGAAG